MTQGSWFNNDGLFLQFGTQKANPEVGGDYLAYGQQRVTEVMIDLVSLTTNPQVQSLTTFWPTGFNIQVDKVEVEVDQASVGGTSFSVGIGNFIAGANSTVTFRTEGQPTASAYAFNTYTQSVPPVNALASTAFVSALVNASTNAAGDLVTLTAGSTSAGTLIGTSFNNSTNQEVYITALAAGTYTGGLVRVRIFWKGVGTITF